MKNVCSRLATARLARRKDTGETEDLVVDMTICEVIRSKMPIAFLITHTPKLQTNQISNNDPSDSRT
jgi:hypothetical protein